MTFHPNVCMRCGSYLRHPEAPCFHCAAVDNRANETYRDIDEKTPVPDKNEDRIDKLLTWFFAMNLALFFMNIFFMYWRAFTR